MKHALIRPRVSKGERKVGGRSDATEAKSVVRSFALPRKCLRTRPTDARLGKGRSQKLGPRRGRRRRTDAIIDDARTKPCQRCNMHRTRDRYFLEVKKLKGRQSEMIKQIEIIQKTVNSFKLFIIWSRQRKTSARSHLYSREAPRRLACAPGCPKILPFLHNCILAPTWSSIF